jgi:hypothetical protein
MQKEVGYVHNENLFCFSGVALREFGTGQFFIVWSSQELQDATICSSTNASSTA